MSELPRRIREARGALSQEEFAHRLGVSTRTPNRWETGKSKPRAKARKALSDLSGKPESYFEDDDSGTSELDHAIAVALREVIQRVIREELGGEFQLAAGDDQVYSLRWVAP